jgi:hypothetical protein
MAIIFYKMDIFVKYIYNYENKESSCPAISQKGSRTVW